MAHLVYAGRVACGPDGGAIWAHKTLVRWANEIGSDEFNKLGDELVAEVASHYEKAARWTSP